MPGRVPGTSAPQRLARRQRRLFVALLLIGLGRITGIVTPLTARMSTRAPLRMLTAVMSQDTAALAAGVMAGRMSNSRT